jgi:hypothetical protein
LRANLSSDFCIKLAACDGGAVAHAVEHRTDFERRQLICGDNDSRRIIDVDQI